MAPVVFPLELLSWAGRGVGKGSAHWWKCCCSFVSVEVPGVAGVHSGRCCVNTKDYFPSLSLLPSREASVSA